MEAVSRIVTTSLDMVQAEVDLLTLQVTRLVKSAGGLLAAIAVMLVGGLMIAFGLAWLLANLIGGALATLSIGGAVAVVGLYLWFRHGRAKP